MIAKLIGMVGKVWKLASRPVQTSFLTFSITLLKVKVIRLVVMVRKLVSQPFSTIPFIIKAQVGKK